MEKYFLKLENISFKIPNTEIYLFRDLNLKIPDSINVIGLVGPNSVGKSLLAQILVGLRKIENGTIKYNNLILNGIKPSKRIKYLSMTFQFANSVFIKQSVEEELRFTIQAKNKLDNKEYDINQISHSKLSQTNLLKGNNPFLLSGGEKRKLIYTLLDIMDPKIYIFDEPTNGLDLIQVKELIDLLTGLLERNKKLIIISHDIKFLSMISSYVVVLEKEKFSNLSIISFQGSFEDLILKNELANFDFLSIPIELEIYKDLFKSNQINQNLEIKTFWSENAEFTKFGEK